MHGLFDNAEIVSGIVEILAKNKGIDISLDKVMDYRQLKELEYDRLADTLREHMNMELIYNMIGVER